MTRQIAINGRTVEIRFPSWATRREGPWIYAGWISIDCEDSTLGIPSYKEMVAKQLRSDHGEIREVDEYPQGAVYWYREQETNR